jgi:hypothetical protein
MPSKDMKSVLFENHTKQTNSEGKMQIFWILCDWLRQAALRNRGLNVG